MNIRRITLLCCAVAAIIATACNAPTENNSIEQMNSRLDRIEAEYASYSDTDWERIDAEFEALSQQIEENYDTMTREEQQEALKALGRYYGLLTRRGIERTQRNIENLPSLIEGFREAFDE